MKYGCIGKSLSHSYSGEIHARLSKEPYALLELDERELPAFFAKKEFCGINVTIPYKEVVIPYLDELDESAKAVGAVNTIVKRDGRLIGYNTDFYGLGALFSRMGVSLKGKRVVILGSGGTAKTARALAKMQGAKAVFVVSRERGKGDLVYGDLQKVAKDVEILIQTTPVGMFPHDEGTPVSLGDFPHLEALVDAVYHPLRTNLVATAQANGINAAGGLYMLVSQAAKSASLFHGTNYDEATVEEIYQALLKEKENLVLIGMPGSGKSTVGRLLAERLGRPFYDLDEEIERRTKKTIPTLFSEGGEALFRAEETDTVAELSKTTGAVIATGGGTPLSKENLVALRRNGSLWLLDRPLEELLPTESRPLANSRAALEQLYSERMPYYRSICDQRIQIDGDPEETVQTLEQKWRNV